MASVGQQRHREEEEKEGKKKATESLGGRVFTYNSQIALWSRQTDQFHRTYFGSLCIDNKTKSIISDLMKQKSYLTLVTRQQ